MKLKSMFVLMAGVAMAPLATAADFSLSLSADDGGRWYEYYSNVYGEIGADLGEVTDSSSADFGLTKDGFFDIASGNAIGSGVVIFPNGGNFLNVGNLSFNDASGQITGLTLDFDRYIADDDAVSNGGYSTSISNLSGSVTRNSEGDVTGINLDSDVTFTYVTTLGTFNYTGDFAISGDAFDLYVDDTNSTAFGDFRYAWDVEGTVRNITPVPEPSVYAMFLSGLAVMGFMARRRRKV